MPSEDLLCNVPGYEFGDLEWYIDQLREEAWFALEFTSDSFWDYLSLTMSKGWAPDGPDGDKFRLQIPEFGKGENLSPLYAKRVGRVHFFAALLELAFDQTTELFQFLPAAQSDWPSHINAWQLRHNLAEGWIQDAIIWTCHLARAAFPFGEAWETHCRTLPIMLAPSDWGIGPHHGKITQEEEVRFAELAAQFRRLPYSNVHHSIDLPVYLDHLKQPPVVMYRDDGEPYGEYEDDGFVESFDPRSETVEDATERILVALRPRVKAAVESIAAADREFHGDMPVLVQRSTRPYEWLVRYQVLSEGMQAISRKDEVDPGYISRSIRETARLIGLNLRPRLKGGRGRKGDVPAQTVDLGLANS